MSAAGPPQGANCSPAFGGSAAAEWVNEAASVGVQMSAAREVKARSARRRASAVAADESRCTGRGGRKEADT